MIRILPYLLYLWLLAMHEVFLKDLTSLWGVSINLVMLMILLTAIYKSEIHTLWFGFFGGLVTFVASGSAWGWHILVIILIAIIAYHLKERMNLESIRAKILLLLGGLLVHNLLVLFIAGQQDILWTIFKQVIPGAVYTTIIGWLYFLFKEGKLTKEKIKAIF